jgi:hypothetical protein
MRKLPASQLEVLKALLTEVRDVVYRFDPAPEQGVSIVPRSAATAVSLLGVTFRAVKSSKRYLG